MGTITANINDEVETLFRKRVSQIYGTGKGTLGKALSEAMLEWARKKQYFETCMNLLEHGTPMGKIKYKTREELYDRHRH